MMERVDPDFAAYVVARWPALVRTVVLLGARHAEAEELAEDALARCYAEWGRIGQTDRDVEVYRALLDVTSRRLVGTVRDPEPGVVTDPTVVEPERAIEQRRDLETALAGLAEAERTTLVLRHTAELDDSQVRDVLGDGVTEPPGRDRLWTPAWFRAAGDAIPVGQPPVQRVVARAHATRRRHRRWGLGIAAALALVVAIGTWIGTRPPGPDLPEPEVQQRANAANLPWYANGLLHLTDVTVRLDQIVDVVEVAEGAVYADRAGRVVRVDEEGVLTELGRAEPGSRIAGSLERGWVAWVERGTSELVVHSVIEGQELGRRPVAEGDRPVAIDQGRVFYTGDGGSWAWELPHGEPEQVAAGEALLDVSSAVRALRVGESISVVQPLFDVDVRVPGEHAEISPDGDHVLTWTGEDDPRDFRVFATNSGEEEAVGLAPDDVPTAAAFGPDNTVTFVVAHRPNEEDQEFMRLSASGPRLLRTCELFGIGGLPPCETVTQFSLNVGVPVLPH